MSLKPIEAGCTAIVINEEFNPSNIGKEVKVVRKLTCFTVPVWLVEGNVIRGKNGQGGLGWATFLEQHLMRIDGEDFPEEISTTKIILTKEKS